MTDNRFSFKKHAKIINLRRKWKVFPFPAGLLTFGSTLGVPEAKSLFKFGNRNGYLPSLTALVRRGKISNTSPTMP